MRIATWQIDLQRCYSTCRLVSGCCIGDPAGSHGQLIGNIGTLGSGNHDIACGMWDQEALIAGAAGWNNEHTTSDMRRVVIGARVGCAGSGKGIDHNCNIWSQALIGHTCTTQTHFFLHSHERRQATWECMSLEAAQEVEQQDAACSIIDPFASNACASQSAQLGENHYRIANAYSKRLYAGSIIDSQINIEIGYGGIASRLTSGQQMTGLGSDDARVSIDPYCTAFEQAWLNTTDGS